MLLKYFAYGRKFNNIRYADDTADVCQETKTTGPPRQGSKRKRDERTKHQLQEKKSMVIKAQSPKR